MLCHHQYASLWYLWCSSLGVFMQNFPTLLPVRKGRLRTFNWFIIFDNIAISFYISGLNSATSNLNFPSIPKFNSPVHTFTRSLMINLMSLYYNGLESCKRNAMSSSCHVSLVTNNYGHVNHGCNNVACDQEEYDWQLRQWTLPWHTTHWDHRVV